MSLLKWSRSYLANIKDGSFTFSEDIVFDKETFAANDRLKDLKDVKVSGKCHYDRELERLYVDLVIDGIMILPCSITFEDVKTEFHIADSEIFAFNKDVDEDVYEVKGDQIELLPLVYQLIMMDIPWNVHKEGLKEYPKGIGWEVIKEEDLNKQSDKVDPRLAKILDYRPKDD
ncbi:MAG: DUF177 domain-containing protein [Erysipelotrichaceae bacterium]|nr:DUF177 domain-containing protein [Erysipelotrichaceae bacterium]MDD4642564.1 DUF177 domain-containing protein [Erysipelotrichaceae bacterium]